MKIKGGAGARTLLFVIQQASATTWRRKTSACAVSPEAPADLFGSKSCFYCRKRPCNQFDQLLCGEKPREKPLLKPCSQAGRGGLKRRTLHTNSSMVLQKINSFTAFSVHQKIRSLLRIHGILKWEGTNPVPALSPLLSNTSRNLHWLMSLQDVMILWSDSTDSSETGNSSYLNFSYFRLLSLPEVISILWHMFLFWLFTSI